MPVTSCLVTFRFLGLRDTIGRASLTRNELIYPPEQNALSDLQVPQLAVPVVVLTLEEWEALVRISVRISIPLIG